jgi:hypothetical protein
MPETNPASAAVAADNERGILLLRFEGSVRAPDLHAAYSHPQTGRAYRPGMLVITDFSRAVLDVRYEEMRAVMEHIDAMFGSAGGAPAGGAIVAPIDVTFGLSRMYKLLTGDTYPTLEVFREWDDAIRWLEIDSKDLEALASRIEAIEL